MKDSPDAPQNPSRRELFKLTFAGGSGLALGGLLDVPAMRAATKDLKLSQVSEFTTSCNFCSCGCGMVAAVKDGKLLTMEGDYDHIVNRGALCVKGISMHATHASPQRLTTPRYRAPGSDHWEDISWEDAIAKVAQKVRKTRDETWIATEKSATRSAGQSDRRDWFHGRRAEHQRRVLPLSEGGPAARAVLRRTSGQALT
jgi:formate dehydrogenase major subunit